MARWRITNEKSPPGPGSSCDQACAPVMLPCTESCAHRHSYDRLRIVGSPSVASICCPSECVYLEVSRCGALDLDVSAAADHRLHAREQGGTEGGSCDRLCPPRLLSGQFIGGSNDR